MTKKHILFPVIKETKYRDDKTPFITKGSLLDYIYYTNGDLYEWVENKVFTDTLTYIDYGRGRSSVTFYFKGTDDAQYPMFLTDMNSLLHNKNIVDSKVSGTWTFAKRGANYGIKLVDEELKVK